jgi:hypothetical protein
MTNIAVASETAHGAIADAARLWRHKAEARKNDHQPKHRDPVEELPKYRILRP